MKSNLLKLYVFAMLFAGDFVMFAQEEDPGDTSGDGPNCEDTLEGCDPAAAPINTKIIWLALFGISFAFYYFNKKKQEKQL